MADQDAASGASASPSLTINRRLDAPPERVYAAWTQPENLIRWFGPTAVRPGSIRAEIDLRVGGHYRIGFDHESGEHHEVSGIYRDVVPNARLIFSWAWHSTPERESLVTVTLKPDGDATILTLHHKRFFDEAARSGHERGWTGTLEKLDRYFS